MNAAGRLIAFSVGLTVAFTATYAAAAAVVPDTAVMARERSAASASESTTPMRAPTSSPVAAGLSLEANGFQLTRMQASAAVGSPGVLSFTILAPAGTPLLDYNTVHDRQLHLIVVRTDGEHFAHVHPLLNRATGTWSTPWTWNAAGTYRVFADFMPATADTAKLTLTSAVDVAGTFTPVRPSASRAVDQVAGYTVHLEGALAAGTSRQLTARITRAGEPVTTLQPYLGAFGHLVALRDGDLAYLHVHSEGAEPAPGRTGGPAVSFEATAPTAGRYLLYLDFRVDKTVHTATFVLDAASRESTAPPTQNTGDGGHVGGH